MNIASFFSQQLQQIFPDTFYLCLRIEFNWAWNELDLGWRWKRPKVIHLDKLVTFKMLRLLVASKDPNTYLLNSLYYYIFFLLGKSAICTTCLSCFIYRSHFAPENDSKFCSWSPHSDTEYSFMYIGILSTYSLCLFGWISSIWLKCKTDFFFAMTLHIYISCKHAF